MSAKETPRSPLLRLCAIVLLTTITTPATGSVCKVYKGPVPNSYSSYTWYIPLYSTGMSATFDVQVSYDFTLALTGINSLVLPLEYYKYKVVYGSFGNTKCGIGPQPYLFSYNGGVLDGNRPVALWLSWAGGVIAGGIGRIVGKNTIMTYADPSPFPINFMLIGGHAVTGNVNITYCYDPRLHDFTLPVNKPQTTTALTTALDCGRLCEDDSLCAGYALARDFALFGNVVCNIFYSISGLQYDPNHVTYLTT